MMPSSPRSPRRLLARGLLLAALALLGTRPALAACDPAQSETPPNAEQLQAAMRAAQDHGYLWRIRKDGRTSYLYGTIHVGQLDWMFPGPRVGQALRDSDALALELDPLDTQVQQRLAQAIAAMPRTALPDELQQRLRREAAALCVNYDTIAGYAPEFQVVTLSAMAGRPQHLLAQYGVDVGLALVAHGSAKPVVSLETPESQMHTLQMKDAAQVLAFVRDSLDELEPGTGTAMLQRMTRAWLAGDTDEMAHYDQWCRCLETAVERELMRRLLDERNPALADAVDRLHAGGRTVFAAVGSLHLFGPLGLPAQMEQRGYRVERLILSAH